jgi:hypothetical protein
MKKTLLMSLAAAFLLLMSNVNFGQAPTLGTVAGFVLFSSNGAVSNTGISQITGNVGTNNGSSTAFGNVNGIMHDNDGASAQCSTDLLTAYNQLAAAIPTFFPSNLLGNGDTLIAGVYSTSSATTLNLDLTLDAKGNSSAVFIFQIGGSFSANASAKIHLINGAMACNVFWKVEGLVSLASGTFMRGTIIANNAAINMSTGDTIEGRALTTTGAITLDGVLAYTPIGCGSPVLTGPVAPSLGSTGCYALFSSDGPVSNSGVTTIKGDIGTNVGSATGFDPLMVTGTIHLIPDTSTAKCAADLLNVYNYLDTLPYDIELLYPAQFGSSLVLTPHTYIMKAAATLTDTVFLNALGNANAVFVIQINGALSTSTYANVTLMNGAQSKNVYWKIEGAVSINNYSTFRGTIVCNNGALGALNTGVVLDGRALLTTGALTATAMTVTTPTSCESSSPGITTQPANQSTIAGGSVSFSVNASGTSLTYQWRIGTTDLTDGGNISGATSSTLAINPVSSSDTASNYNVVITGANSQTVTSANISLGLNSAPDITAQPADKTSCAGSSVSFSVSAAGTGLSYQWKKGSSNLSNGGNISGATSATLTIDPITSVDAAVNYSVVVNGTIAPNKTSANAALVVNIAPSITTGPTDQTVNAGSSASFSVIASGTGLTYQWRKGMLNLTNAGNISGATSSELTIDQTIVSDSGFNYNVVVTGTCSPISSSVNANLSVTGLTGISSYNLGNSKDAVTVYPNPFSTTVNVMINDASFTGKYELKVYNILGKELIHSIITNQSTTIDARHLPRGIYLYKVIGDNKTIQSGKLISQ